MGSTQEKLVPNPLAALSLNNQLHIYLCKILIILQPCVVIHWICDMVGSWPIHHIVSYLYDIIVIWQHWLVIQGIEIMFEGGKKLESGYFKGVHKVKTLK